MSKVETVSELISQRRFLNDVEQGIKAANRQVIHAAVPELNKDSFFGLAVALAKLRANYLQTALRILRTPDEELPVVLAEVKCRREAFEEGSKAFEALERAIQRGYVDISGA